MRLVRSRLLAAVLLLGAAGCEKQVDAPHGSPVLLEVVWASVSDAVPTLVWSRDADASVQATAPAAGSKIDFVFDRRLDGARVEDTVNGNPVPKANPPITVGWPDMDTVMSDPAFAADVFYNSVAYYGPGTSSAFVLPHVAGFPSDTPVTFTLDPNGLTSTYGEPMDGPATITVMTGPLALTLPAAGAPVSTTYFAPIAFSTRAPTPSALRPFVHVQAGGAALAFDLARDGGDSKRVLVIPSCGWPSGVRVDVSVAAGAPDGFGRPLAAAAMGGFMVAAVDGGCGTPDGGAPDAPGDATSSDDAPDAADGGVPDDGGAGDAAADAAPADAQSS